MLIYYSRVKIEGPRPLSLSLRSKCKQTRDVTTPFPKSANPDRALIEETETNPFSKGCRCDIFPV